MEERISPEVASKENLRLLVEGELSWEDVKKLLRLDVKEKERFFQYVEILQEKVPWKDKILLPLSENVYIVRKDDGRRIVKCKCGHELGDYRVNWKLNCLVYVRKTAEEFAEVYTQGISWPSPELVEIREFYCPGCLTQLGVEVVPPGYPVLFDVFPDLDALYREWLEAPLEDEQPEWFQDKTWEEVSRWAVEK